MDIEPPDPESTLEHLFPVWDQLFADASHAHERVKSIQNRLKLIPATSRDPNREALLRDLEVATLEVQEVAVRITAFCGNRDFSPQGE